jgi:uncharacterized protein YfaS (alpha-2-macroglobulin family)
MLIECVIDRDDCRSDLISWGRRVAVANTRPLQPRPAGIRYVDYGSELRDSAAVLGFAAANPGNQTRLSEIIDRIAERFSRAVRTSAQERAWLLMAAEAAASRNLDFMCRAEYPERVEAV